MIHYIKNLKIRLKLYILIGVALLGMLIISGMSFFLMGRMNDMTSDIATSWLPSIDAARELSATISNIRLNELGYLTADADNKKETSYQYLQDGIETMDALLAAYGDMIDEEERNFYDNANNLWTQYQEAEEEMMAFAKQGRSESARAILDGECEALYMSEHGKSCPTEILEAMGFIRAEGRPIWKPMHMQPIYRRNEFIGREGSCLGSSSLDVGMDIFNRGLCLPSHVKMTEEEQNRIIEVIRACFE